MLTLITCDLCGCQPTSGYRYVIRAGALPNIPSESRVRCPRNASPAACLRQRRANVRPSP